LRSRLSDAAYAAGLATLPANAKQRAARARVLAAPPADRTRVWLVQHILDPRFDAPAGVMPDLGVPAAHAEAIATLLTSAQEPVKRERLTTRPPVSMRDRLLAFPLGHGLAGLAGATIGWLASRTLRTRTGGRG
jgi:hypothetical protein